MNQNPGAVNPAQKIEQEAYVPTYRIKPEFQKAVLGAIGKFPFNQIQAIMAAVNVEKMDHNQLTQIMNAIGSMPYENVAGFMATVNQYIELIEPVDEAEAEVEVTLPPESSPEASLDKAIETAK